MLFNIPKVNSTLFSTHIPVTATIISIVEEDVWNQEEMMQPCRGYKVIARVNNEGRTEEIVRNMLVEKSSRFKRVAKRKVVKQLKAIYVGYKLDFTTINPCIERIATESVVGSK